MGIYSLFGMDFVFWCGRYPPFVRAQGFNIFMIWSPVYWQPIRVPSVGNDILGAGKSVQVGTGRTEDVESEVRDQCRWIFAADESLLGEKMNNQLRIAGLGFVATVGTVGSRGRF